MSLQSTFLVVDCETTGLPQRPELDPIASPEAWPHLVQLCATRYSPGLATPALEFVCLIRPDGWVIPPEATEKHRITTDMAFARGLPLSAALQLLFCVMEKPHALVAHGLQFDGGVIAAATARVFGKSAAEARWRGARGICTMASGAALINSGRRPRLGDLHERLLGWRPPVVHDARADVRATYRCLRTMMSTGYAPTTDLLLPAGRGAVNNLALAA